MTEPTQALVTFQIVIVYFENSEEYFGTNFLSEAREDCHWSAGKNWMFWNDNPQLFALRESGLGADARRLKQKNGEAS